MSQRFLKSFSQPIKATRDFIRRPNMDTFGGALLGAEKMNMEQFQAVADATPWNDESATNKFESHTVGSRDFRQGAGALGALLAAIYGGAWAAGGSSGGAAAGSGAAGAGTAGAASAGGTAAGTGTAAGSYGAGAYGTSAGYGGTAAPYAYSSSMPQSAGIMSTMGGYAKTGMQGMQAANMAKGLFGEQPRQQQPMLQQQPSTGQQTLLGIVNDDNQRMAAAMQEDLKRRGLNQELINMIMGQRNG